MTTDHEQPEQQATKPRPVTDELRAQVAELHAKGLGRNAIARAVGTSAATVSKIARQHEPPLEFDRSATALALQAKLIDMGSAKADLAAMFLIRARELLEEVDAPFILGEFGGKDHVWHERLLPEPPVDAKRTLVAAAATATRAGVELTKVNAPTMPTEAAIGMVTALHAGLGLAVEALEASGDMPDPTETPEQRR